MRKWFVVSQRVTSHRSYQLSYQCRRQFYNGVNILSWNKICNFHLSVKISYWIILYLKGLVTSGIPQMMWVLFQCHMMFGVRDGTGNLNTFVIQNSVAFNRLLHILGNLKRTLQFFVAFLKNYFWCYNILADWKLAGYVRFSEDRLIVHVSNFAASVVSYCML